MGGGSYNHSGAVSRSDTTAGTPECDYDTRGSGILASDISDSRMGSKIELESQNQNEPPCPFLFKPQSHNDDLPTTSPLSPNTTWSWFRRGPVSPTYPNELTRSGGLLTPSEVDFAESSEDRRSGRSNRSHSDSNAVRRHFFARFEKKQLDEVNDDIEAGWKCGVCGSAQPPPAQDNDPLSPLPYASGGDEGDDMECLGKSGSEITSAADSWSLSTSRSRDGFKPSLIYPEFPHRDTSVGSTVGEQMEIEEDYFSYHRGRGRARSWEQGGQFKGGLSSEVPPTSRHQHQIRKQKHASKSSKLPNIPDVSTPSYPTYRSTFHTHTPMHYLGIAFRVVGLAILLAALLPGRLFRS
ncbi:hypothetical protein BU17DRAFT_86852 [Hysterangium stoloniferum]|nr:hypothetical protein BU17DRAFT_86852 [Hysterangium stoloniferum]